MSAPVYVFPRALPNAKFPPDECLRILQEHAGITLRDAAALVAFHAHLITDTVPGEPADALVEAAEKAGRHPMLHLCINSFECADFFIAASAAKP